MTLTNTCHCCFNKRFPVSIIFFHFVANAPHHLYISWLFCINLNLFPDMPNMHHHCIFHCIICRFFPYIFINLFFGKNLLLMRNEKIKYIKLFCCKLYDIACFVWYSTSKRIDYKICPVLLYISRSGTYLFR